ncbi:MAG: hypothetical protein MI748_16225 [Opitutales bacterium]|nr:hypothetical protein [Opitutales bacterium]
MNSSKGFTEEELLRMRLRFVAQRTRVPTAERKNRLVQSRLLYPEMKDVRVFGLGF